MKTDHRPTTCIGVDITWWGGSRKVLASRRETIVAIRLDGGADITVEMVDLSPVPNPLGSEPGEANYDRDGSYLVDALLKISNAVAGSDDRIVIALDAPLESKDRPDQKPRVKAVPKGEKMGSIRRQCETALTEHAGRLGEETRRAWNRDLKIQSGSPIAPRIASVLRLLKERGYEIVSNSESPPDKAIIEIFPSQAIWALGSAGHYGALSSKDVRAYKAKTDKVMAVADARTIAARPLEGFLAVLCAEDGLDKAIFSGWVRTLSEHAIACSLGPDSTTVHKGKGFDDPIDSGLAALTCVAYAIERFQLFGDGSDGAIVGSRL